MTRAAQVEQVGLMLPTPGRGLVDITEHLRKLLPNAGVTFGVAHVFVHHTSCSLIIGENADPAVGRDLDRFFARLVPDGDPLFEHDAEGDDDMPAHVRSVLTATNLSIPVTAHRLDLGTWQGVFLYEHRTQPQERRITLTVTGGRIDG